ncbi:MAG: hypothetical protein RQ751_05520 [Longimicrobiales bacterium]|nr:hypothetical protein [Longimicrobiales bacterium]
MNGEELPSIRSLALDARVSVLEAGRVPEYPEPASHHDFAWSWTHGEVAAKRPGYCGNCHARESCVSCHVTYAGAVVDQLPALERDDGRGVRVEGSAGVHEPGFAITHAARGAMDDGTCRSCHSTPFCESCHDGPTQPSFHFGNYLQLHGAEAWGSEFECATCHNPDVFCRGCHESVGRGSEGRLDVAYHSRSPFWLFAHGNAARQALETCRTCHSQSDCAICHAAVGSWRINPHGPGFDAARLRDANVWSCLACHRNGIPPT